MGVPRNERDDRLLAPTLWTAVLIVPVLVAAFVILYFFPAHTRQLWAWTIKGTMTPMMMGGGYLSGAFFFTRVATVRRWHTVWPGFVATTVFTSFLLGATLLHWDKFNHGHISFWAWLSLYVVTPPLLPLLWFNNRRTDPGATAADVRLDRRLRRLVAAGGGALALFAIVMFVRPSVVMAHWPWTLTPLTARTVSAFIAFPAVSCTCALVEDRWSSLRIPIETVTLGLVLVGIAAIRGHRELNSPAPAVPLFVTSLVATILLLVALQVVMDRKAGGDLSLRPAAGPAIE